MLFLYQMSFRRVHEDMKYIILKQENLFQKKDNSRQNVKKVISFRFSADLTFRSTTELRRQEPSRDSFAEYLI